MDSNPEKTKLLVIDDNPVDRKLIKSFFEQDDFLLFEADEGKTGLAMAMQHMPDIILLDILMPGMDGLTICTRLKMVELTRSIPVILISSTKELLVKIRGLEIGAVDFITKPPIKDEVRARVRAHLKIARLTKSLEKANRILVRKQKKIELDLQAAAEIQKNLLPGKLPDCPVKFSWHFEPSSKIGGDIFNIHRLDEHHIGIYIIDVSGHGVPAAMITAFVSQAMSPSNSLVKRQISSAPFYKIVQPVDLIKKIEQEFPIERFNRYITMNYLVLNFQSGDFNYCCAGHPPAVLVRRQGEPELLDTGGALIGLGDMAPPLQQGAGHIDSGDRLYFYTDGIIEHENSVGEQFGIPRLVHTLMQEKELSLDHSITEFIAHFKNFEPGSIPIDDISLLAIELRNS
ncbi:MAG: fused response regulator/phosphatase [Desulfobulbaceae bacterium]|nr:fused response regulator/phosphatase [Desulfobulbaceae bacterium]